MNELQVFNYQSKQVRTVEKDGETFFVARDVCEILDLENASQATVRLDDDEKGVISIDTLGGQQNMITVNEAGLYSLILGSRKPEAKDFKRWVTHKVLPSIRQTGTYALPQMTAMEMIATIAQETIKLEKKVDAAMQRADDAFGRVGQAFDIFTKDEGKDWRQFTDDAVRQMCQEYGLCFMTEYGAMYKELDDKAGVDIDARLKRLKERLLKEGHTKTYCNGITKLEVVDRDVKLRAIFDGILKKHQLKHANSRH